MGSPFLSVVIPVYNEEEVLELLYQRLFSALDQLDKTFEVIFINDGSRDRSIEILREFYNRRPTQVRVVDFNGNFGQHMAIMAGFERVRGELIVTMDSDLQNPPEEIGKIVAAFAEGYDVINSYRMDRQDRKWRLLVSGLHNWFRAKLIPKYKLKDEGCMLRGYSRRVVDLMASTQETSTFIPVLALMYARNTTEVGVKHEERAAGTSGYGFYKLIRYNFDLVTNFSLTPLHLITFFGMLVSFVSFLCFLFLIIRRIVSGPDAEGVFTIFAVLFLLLGFLFISVGLIGEYVGRIYQEVRKRPRYVIDSVLEMKSDS